MALLFIFSVSPLRFGFRYYFLSRREVFLSSYRSAATGFLASAPGWLKPPGFDYAASCRISPLSLMPPRLLFSRRCGFAFIDFLAMPYFRFIFFFDFRCFLHAFIASLTDQPLTEDILLMLIFAADISLFSPRLISRRDFRPPRRRRALPMPARCSAAAAAPTPRFSRRRRYAFIILIIFACLR